MRSGEARSLLYQKNEDMASDGLTQVPLVGHHLKWALKGLGSARIVGCPKLQGVKAMIRADYIDHGRSSRAIIMTKGRTLHCERETGGVTI